MREIMITHIGAMTMQSNTKSNAMHLIFNLLFGASCSSTPPSSPFSFLDFFDSDRLRMRCAAFTAATLIFTTSAKAKGKVRERRKQLSTISLFSAKQKSMARR